MPAGLCRAFGHSRVWGVDSNTYRNGEHQARARTSTSRKSWDLTRHVTRTELEELRSLYTDRGGGLEPFYFYDPYEPASGQPIGSNWDETGESTQGRYTVVFRGEFSQAASMGRSEASLQLVEVN
jgi:phage-related protein